MMTYCVRCRVSGGVTGTREAWLKREGVVAEFETMADAQAEATRLNRETETDRYRVAYYQYWAVERAI